MPRRNSKKRSSKHCTPGNKKFAKMVNGKCIRFGDPNMTIKKNIPSRKKSFCARHQCSKKTDPATPGYQSCKKWDCKTGPIKISNRRNNRRSNRRSNRLSNRRSNRRSTRRSNRRSKRR